METKSELRKKIIKTRNALSWHDVQLKSREIFDKLCSLNQYENARTVMTYLDYRNEVSTRDFINKCIADKKRVALPKVIPGLDRELRAYQIQSLTEDTHSGYKGILEPKESAVKLVEPSEIDLAIIPGVVFDCERQRLGYGAGYYDRFLTGLRHDCVKIGVAFSLQVLNKIPCEEHDIPMDIIITEKSII